MRPYMYAYVERERERERERESEREREMPLHIDGFQVAKRLAASSPASPKP